MAIDKRIIEALNSIGCCNVRILIFNRGGITGPVVTFSVDDPEREIKVLYFLKDCHINWKYRDCWDIVVESYLEMDLGEHHERHIQISYGLKPLFVEQGNFLDKINDHLDDFVNEMKLKLTARPSTIPLKDFEEVLKV